MALPGCAAQRSEDPEGGGILCPRCHPKLGKKAVLELRVRLSSNHLLCIQEMWIKSSTCMSY